MTKRKQILLLHHNTDKNFKEIANIVGVEHKEVCNICHDEYANMRKRYKDDILYRAILCITGNNKCLAKLTYNILKQADINSLQELHELGDLQFLVKMRNCGVKVINTINELYDIWYKSIPICVFYDEMYDMDEDKPCKYYDTYYNNLPSEVNNPIDTQNTEFICKEKDNPRIKIANNLFSRAFIVDTEDEIYNAIISVTNNNHMISRTYRVLLEEGVDTLDKLKDLTDDEMDNIHGCGEKMKHIIKSIIQS